MTSDRRYSWPLVRPVLEVLLDNDIAEFEAFSRVEVRPQSRVLIDCACTCLGLHAIITVFVPC